jgi:hypothetical protein
MNALLRLALAGAVLGALIGFVAAQLMPTSHAEAMAKAAAIAPEGADASPTGEFDYPFWYGGSYQAVQTFTGGARDRPHLTEVMTLQLDRHGWEIVGVEDHPGATAITAFHDDLEVVVQARHLPPTGPVEGIITVMYRHEPPTAVLVLAAAASGAASGAIAAWRSAPGTR